MDRIRIFTFGSMEQNTNKINPMKQLTSLSVLTFILLISACSEPKGPNMPQPTDTIVKMDAEDHPKKAARQAWFDLMHQSAEGVRWEDIEYQNQKDLVEYKSYLAKLQNDSRNDEVVADGWVTGTWTERGSLNQAGSILVTKYDAETDIIYCVSAGGTLWKGPSDGSDWTVVNQDFRFANHYLDILTMPDGSKRLVAAINGSPHYSDDDGLTWTIADFAFAADGWQLYDYCRLSNGDMFVLFRPNRNTTVRMYRSIDNGASFTKEETFTNENVRNYNMRHVPGTDQLYVIEQRTSSTSRLYSWSAEDQNLSVIRATTEVGFGSANKRATLRPILHNDSLKLYAVNGDNQFVRSVDTGSTWTVLSTLATSPWAVGFEVLPSDPSTMIYGEVEAYNSTIGGKQWIKISNWWDYYPDPFTKLHADIMDIEEYTIADGEHFTLISNHGGINRTTDGGSNTVNISLFGLNVSQYYDVRTHPTDRRFVFAGSQDQGFQVGRFDGGGVESFDQVISGDYGHIEFSGEDDNLWTVYPGGSISYYDNPKTQGPTLWWELESEDESVWIPPLLAHPDRSVNAIYMAGGSIDEGTGSYMIRLDAIGGVIIPSQFDFDFLAASGGHVSAMAFSPFDHDRIYVATTNGVLFLSDDGGLSFTLQQDTNADGHYLYGSHLMASTTDPNTVYLSGSGYSGPAVWVSHDGGQTYSPMNTGMPQTLAFGLAANEDESLIFAATEAGPYVYVKESEQWHSLAGMNTPNQRNWSVEYIPELNTARFGTYGRGIWDFTISEMSVNTEEQTEVQQLSVYPNPTSDIVTISSNITNGKVSIMDLSGKLLHSEISRGSNAIDISDYPSGTYVVTLVSGSQVMESTKLIKQ